MRERERLLFDESATFTRDVMDVQTTAKCATFVTTLEFLSREKNAKVLSLNKNDLSRRRRVPPLGVDDFSLGNWR